MICVVASPRNQRTRDAEAEESFRVQSPELGERAMNIRSEENGQREFAKEIEACFQQG